MAEIVSTTERDGRVINVYDDGTQKYQDNGRLAAQHPMYKMTPERGKALAEQKKIKGIMSQLRGLAAAEGAELPPDAELEQVIEGAGDALEAITTHFAKTFKQSSNLRGMAEGYRQLAAPLIGERDERGTGNTINIIQPLPDDVARFISDLHRLQMQQRTDPPVNVIDGLLARADADIIEGKAEG